MKQRVEEIDFLKCIFILLMIVFHLRYIGDTYPYVKSLVYTFHMPAFLIISGYLMNVQKTAFQFLRAMRWIFVPYALMETGYVLMSAVLPVRDRVDDLSFLLWADKLFLHPLGPYWYLHTLMLCGSTYYLVNRFSCLWRTNLAVLIVLALCYAGWSCVGILSLPNALYFTAGVALRRSRLQFLDFFRPSAWAVIPFILLALSPNNLDRALSEGILLTYLAMSIGLTLVRYLSETIKQTCCYIGEHTFVLLIFSPIFTMAVKPLANVFAFDSSGMLFLTVSLLITLIGCFILAWVIDYLHLSPYFWGKERMMQPFPKYHAKMTDN